MINEKDVTKMAELARIKLNAKEKKELSGELESILNYIDKLKEVGVEGVKDTGHVFHANNFRFDEVAKETFNSAYLLESAPQTERGFIKVKKVLDK